MGVAPAQPCAEQEERLPGEGIEKPYPVRAGISRQRDSIVELNRQPERERRQKHHSRPGPEAGQYEGENRQQHDVKRQDVDERRRCQQGGRGGGIGERMFGEGSEHAPARLAIPECHGKQGDGDDQHPLVEIDLADPPEDRPEHPPEAVAAQPATIGDGDRDARQEDESLRVFHVAEIVELQILQLGRKQDGEMRGDHEDQEQAAQAVQRRQPHGAATLHRRTCRPPRASLRSGFRSPPRRRGRSG